LTYNFRVCQIHLKTCKNLHSTDHVHGPIPQETDLIGSPCCLGYFGEKATLAFCSIQCRIGLQFAKVIEANKCHANLLRVLTSGNSTRLRQGLGLANALDELDADYGQLVAVIGGDVNSWSEKESVIRHLSEQFPDSPPASGEGTRGSYPTDHMFVRTFDGSNVSVADNSYRVIPDEYGSDHRGKVLTLHFASD